MSAETPAAAPKKSRKKLVLIVALGLALACGGAGAAWFVLRKPADPNAPVAQKPAPKPVFAPLEVFTVNLQDVQGDRFAQIGITLQLKDEAAELLLKDHLPAVRNEILLLLASKRTDEILNDDGKRALAEQVRERALRALGAKPAEAPAAAAPAPAPAARVAAADTPVQQVLFSQFIVQ